MSLFGQLADDIFLIFSRANRHFYARVVLELFERFFSDTVTFPGRHDVVGAIYDTLKSHPDLWTDDDDDFSDVPEQPAGCGGEGPEPRPQPRLSGLSRDDHGTGARSVSS